MPKDKKRILITLCCSQCESSTEGQDFVVTNKEQVLCATCWTELFLGHFIIKRKRSEPQ